MPLITIKILGEKTTEQKRNLVKDITAAVVKDLNDPPEVVTIDIVEMSPNNFAVAGQLFVDR
jgi:4-oxalocrotonate tautomerase